VDIPPRLAELCEDKKTMLYAQQSLRQVENGKPDLKLIADEPKKVRP
jgi:predicted deacylase